MRRLLIICAIATGALTSPALAHPHIFIDAKASIVFDGEGRVAAIHHEWTFDEAYSAWAVQGLDTDGDGVVTTAETQELADDNMVGLSDYAYYTFAGEGKDTLAFGKGSGATLDYQGGRTTLSFDIEFDTPYRIRKALEIAINDPEYYVAITFADIGAVKLFNAPKDCSAALEAGHTMPDELADQLYALPPDITRLPPDLQQALRGVQGAIVVSCPSGAEGTGVATQETALEAATQVAQAPATISAPVAATAIPFGGPPPEPGLNLPRTGFFGWVAQQQKDFYVALTAALGRLSSDWTAFWVLGGLSFLYGIFHAAGPGHGKIVISSYVLANEQQVRRGVLLSFLAAMLQSAVAVAFVLVLALGLGLTSLALSDAANWIGIVSYGLVALLGAWLIVRHLMGWGRHAHEDHHDESEPTAAEHLAIGQHLKQARAHALLHGEPAVAAFALTGADAHGRLPNDPHYGHNHGAPAPGRPPHEHGHDHAHVVTPRDLRGGWKEQLGVVVVVGLRPCSGALVVLVFALSQGLLMAGIAAVFLMGLGTAITTGALAAMAVGAKGLAQRFAGVDTPWTAMLVWWAELVGALIVFGFGAVLLAASL